MGYLGVAWAFGGTILVLVYCTRGISGGHINPAVTFGLLVGRKLSLVRAALLHGIGRVTVANPVWTRPGKLEPADWLKVRQVPFWTARAGARPVPTPLAQEAAA